MLQRKVLCLSSGKFGSVNRGQWTSERGVMKVAVKTLTDQEAAIMAQFKHPNVIALCGVISNGVRVSIICTTPTLNVKLAHITT